MGAARQLLDTYAGFSVQDWITYVLLFLACLAPLLQCRLIWQKKSAEGMSLVLFVIFLAVSVRLMQTGIRDHDPSLWLSEIVGIGTNGLACGLILRFKSKAGDTAEQVSEPGNTERDQMDLIDSAEPQVVVAFNGVAPLDQHLAEGAGR